MGNLSLFNEFINSIKFSYVVTSPNTGSEEFYAYSDSSCATPSYVIKQTSGFNNINCKFGKWDEFIFFFICFYYPFFNIYVNLFFVFYFFLLYFNYPQTYK